MGKLLMTASGRENLASTHRLVVKIGSNALCRADGAIDREVLEAVASEIAVLRKKGLEAVVITSGAVKIGLCRLGAAEAKDLPTRQSAAAVGQSELIAAYQHAFAEHGYPIAQILLTQNELSDYRRYLHLRNLLNALLEHHGAVPVLNENDPVSAQGVEIGENDRLAALVGAKVGADILVLLSDVDGFYTGNPSRGNEVKLIPEVEKITPELKALAEKADDRGGSGGMQAKLEAVTVATRAGVGVIIASSRTPKILSRLLAGEQLGTYFHPAVTKLPSRKRWIGFARPPKGKLVVDEGAGRAVLERGSSLLPVGIANVEGNFKAGDTVSIVDFAGKEIARGLTNYNSEEVSLIRRCKTQELEAKLGRHDYDEVVHRDNLVVL